MPALNRILLINTHMSGVVELKLSGHTNICGTNASGKTTLQRLIPVFYGEYPSRVVPATRDSFEKWYLPTDSSYIIYEYQRDSQETYQVVLSSSGQGVDYRFISKPFDIADYSVSSRGEKSIIVAPKELFRGVKRQGVLCSRKLNTKEYKAIIQNDKAVLNTNRDLPGLARLFSLCEQSENLRHIEKLAKAVHSKEGKMETIKAMVAAILEEDGVQPGETKLSANKVEEWLKEVKLVKSFADIRPTFTKLEQSYSQYQLSTTRLAQLKQHFTFDISQVSKQSLDYTEQLALSIENLKQLDSNWSVTRDELNQTLSVAKADQKKLENDLDQIEEDYEQWQQKDIDELQDSVSQLSSWKTKLGSEQQNYELLTNKHKDVEATYHQRKSDYQERKSSELELVNEQLEQLKQELVNQQQQQSTQVAQIQKQYEDKTRQSQQDYQQQLHQLELEKKQFSLLLNNVGLSQDELKQIAIFEHEIKESVSVEDLSRERVLQAQTELDDIKQVRQKLDKELEHNRIAQNEHTQAIAQTEKLLYPEDGTLLAFLRENYDNWQCHIGKVISPQLLNRTDLKPAYEPSSDSSVFGLTIDLDAITLPDIAISELDLKKQLELEQQQLSETLNQQSEIEVQLVDLNKQIRALELQLVKYSTELTNATSARKRAQQDKDDALIEFGQAVQERKKEHQKLISENTQQIQKVELLQSQAMEELLDQQREAEMELKTHWQTLIADTQNHISSAERRKDDIKSDYEVELANLDRWLESELSNRGVDVDEIGQLKRHIDSLKKTITKTEQNSHLVAEYKHWYQTYYLGYKLQWQQQLSQVRQTVSETTRTYEKQQQEFKQKLHAEKDNQKQLEKNLKITKDNEVALSDALKQIKKLSLDEVEFEKDNLTVSQRISEGFELLHDREEQLSNIKAWVEYFDQTIAAQSGTGFYDTWERSRQECTMVDSSGLRQLDHIRLVTHLDQLINVLVPQKVSAIREQGRIFGLALSEYYKLLKDIENHIGHQSKRISEEVEQELFLDGVSDSAVLIRSKISELEFWPELKAFNSLYEKWINSGAHELPSADYVYSMKRVIDILGRSALSGGVSKLLDIELHIKEGQSNLVIRTDRQLNESSSHGMAYLILCKFLLAFTRLLRGNSETTIHWPIDELGTLHQSNIKKIFDACQKNNIHVVGAFPNPESEVLNLFENRYLIDKQKRQLQIVKPKASVIAQAIKDRKNGASQEVSA